ncbi:MAG: hypothetical protein C5B52_11880 [Bacteroidetes bacterium]|nr:MAG: hypothetical protein C5B52_11880 [Bacteroidota bacterium]
MKKSPLIPTGIIICIVFACSCLFKNESNSPDGGAALVDFNFQIKPILSDRCFKCHGPDARNRKAGLRLDIEESAFAALKDNPDGHVIVKGNPEASEMVKRIYSTDPQYMMPPPSSNLALTDIERGLIKKWISQGAKWKKHWAYILPEKQALPKVSDASWPKNEIDYFTLAKMDERGLEHAKEADKERLLRRLAFDITGLPPSVEQVDRFLNDKSPDAYSKMVDEFLASPAYGERWADYWLDVSRYGDTHGYQDDLPRVMWPWRDWVIKAFNENMPYDKFVTWQIAGDLLPNATKEQKLASAFNRNHKISQEGGIIDEEYRVEYVADRTNTFGKAFLAVSFECSRCHDHKYDPITQKDYYSLFSFFNKVKEFGFVINLATPDPWMPIIKKDLEGDLKFLNASSVLLTDKDTIRQMVMVDSPGIRKSYVLKRGAYDAHGDEVNPNMPASILKYDSTYPRNRLGLAEWLFDPRNPLPSRVIVNRVWQELFGRGIVQSSEDFGNQGSIPSHPALLDWLAVDFRENGWNIKSLIKKIVLSATYQQASNSSESAREKDPDNIFLARGPRYRMNSEMIRDNVLFSSGLLNKEIGGPSVKPYQPEGIWEDVSVGDKSGFRGEKSYIIDTGNKVYRRSLYTYWRRTVPPPSMITFDNPMKEMCEVRRARTSTPLQALVLLNDPQVMEASRVLAYQEFQNSNMSESQMIADAFRRILTRKAEQKEIDLLKEFYETELAKYKSDKKSAIALLKVGHFPQNKNIDPSACAAMMLTIQTIYNLDEAMTKS